MALKTKFKSRIAANGQVVIPKEFRDALGLHGGDMVVFIAEEDEAGIIQVVIRKPAFAFAGLVGRLKHLAKVPYDLLLKDLDNEDAK